MYNSGRLATALAAWEKVTPPARIFAAMAGFWEEAGLPPTLSQQDLFAAFWRCVEALTPLEVREQVRDALCYDLCRTDYPAGHELAFFSREDEGKRGSEEKELALGLARQRGCDPASRVRWVSHRFARDYRRSPWGEGDIELLFAYISAAGRGLVVEIAEVGRRGTGKDT